VRPVRTPGSNFVYRGPTPDIGDAWVERAPAERVVYLDWQPSEEERAAIAAGALVRLGIHGMEPIPAVSLNVSDRQAITPAAEAWRDRAHEMVKAISRGPASVPAGFWAVSSDVWEALQRDRALDPTDGVPTLYSRPLMVVDGGPDHLEFVVSRQEARA
jgi:hypothetical protein